MCEDAELDEQAFGPAVGCLPLWRAALCADDDVIFDMRLGQCPQCGGTSWTLLSKFLERTA